MKWGFDRNLKGKTEEFKGKFGGDLRDFARNILARKQDPLRI